MTRDCWPRPGMLVSVACNGIVLWEHPWRGTIAPEATGYARTNDVCLVLATTEGMAMLLCGLQLGWVTKSWLAWS